MSKIVSKAYQVRLAYQMKVGRKVTAQEVAEAIGVTNSTLSRIEQSKTERIDFDTLRKLCDYYGVSVGDILELVEADAEETTQKNETPGLVPAYAA